MRILWSLRKHLWHTISKQRLVILVFLTLITVTSCGLLENPIPSVNEEYSMQELGVSENMTVLELATIADGLVGDWQPQAYLRSLFFRLDCDGVVEIALFEYITEKPHLWYERQIYAWVSFDFEERKVDLHGEDVNDAGLLGPRLKLDELEIDLASVVVEANAQDGAAYCKKAPNYFIAASLDRNGWLISYGRRGELIHDFKVRFNAHTQ